MKKDNPIEAEKHEKSSKLEIILLELEEKGVSFRNYSKQIEEIVEHEDRINKLDNLNSIATTDSKFGSKDDFFNADSTSRRSVNSNSRAINIEKERLKKLLAELPKSLAECLKEILNKLTPR